MFLLRLRRSASTTPMVAAWACARPGPAGRPYPRRTCPTSPGCTPLRWGVYDSRDTNWKKFPPPPPITPKPILIQLNSLISYSCFVLLANILFLSAPESQFTLTSPPPLFHGLFNRIFLTLQFPVFSIILYRDEFIRLFFFWRLNFS